MNELFPTANHDFERYGKLRDPYGIFQISDIDDATPPADGEQPFYVGQAVSGARLRLVFAFFVLALVGIVTRAAQLQLGEGGRLAALAEGNRVRIETVPTERGVIYDRQGVTLVRNIPDFSAAVTPADLPREAAAREATIARIADILGMAPLEIENRLLAASADDRAAPVVVADNLAHDEAVKVKIEEMRTPALTLDTGLRREYLGTAETASLSHILGYVGKVDTQDLARHADYLSTDYIGKTGLERSYESALRGRYGKSRIEVDATGSLKQVIASDAGDPGQNLYLTLDYGLQRDVNKLLIEGLKNAHAERGSAIVMNARTGDILALVSLPAYDDNAFAQGIADDAYQKLMSDKNHPLFPRAIAALLPSGSTFKPVVAAGALTEGLITAATTIFSTGGLTVGRSYFPDWKAGGHGITNVMKALADSVNSFFYIIGGGYDSYPNIHPLGPDGIAAYARLFGFGAPTGIDLPGEASGLVPTPAWKQAVRGERWYIGDTYHLAIGQGDLLVTPLQIARMTAAVANGGRLVTPRLVAALGGPDGETVIPPQVDNPQVVPADVIDVIRRGMRQTVTAGSARSFSILPWPLAAKTGTAQWNSQKPPHAWFTSFGPYDNPEIVVTVVIEEGGEGSTAAAPVAKAIYARYFTGRFTDLAAPLPSKPAPTETAPAAPVAVPPETTSATPPAAGPAAPTDATPEAAAPAPEAGLHRDDFGSLAP